MCLKCFHTSGLAFEAAPPMLSYIRVLPLDSMTHGNDCTLFWRFPYLVGSLRSHRLSLMLDVASPLLRSEIVAHN